MQAHQGHRPDRDCPKLHLWMCLWRRRQAGRHAWPQAGSPRTMVFMPALRRRRKRPTVTSYAANHEHLGGRRGPPDLRAPKSHAPLRASPCRKGQSASILERRRCVEASQGGEGRRCSGGGGGGEAKRGGSRGTRREVRVRATILFLPLTLLRGGRARQIRACGRGLVGRHQTKGGTRQVSNQKEDTKASIHAVRAKGSCL